TASGSSPVVKKSSARCSRTDATLNRPRSSRVEAWVTSKLAERRPRSATTRSAIDSSAGAGRRTTSCWEPPEQGTLSTRGGPGPTGVAASTNMLAATHRPTTLRARLRSRALVPGAVLDRWRKPDSLVVLLQHLFPRDFILRAQLGVLGLGRTRVVA